jgi:chromosome segregation ATPase
MSEIVERLLDWSEHDEGKINDVREEAADTITRLTADNEKLAKALETAGRLFAASRDALAEVNAENEKLGRDYQSARDAHDRILAENEKLREALASIDELFSEAAQDDCENGVRWLNERAASKYLAEYPHTSAAISLVHKTARAALSGDKHE